MSFCPRVVRCSFLSRGRLSLTALLLFVAPGFGAAAQADDGSSVRRAVRAVPADATGAEHARENDVTGRTFFRPLRTFQGRPVRVGPGNRSELSIGVVRAIRADGSKSIGVVRPIRSVFTDGGYGGFRTLTPTPPVQPGGLVGTRGDADHADATSTSGAPAAPTEPGRVLVPGIGSGGLGTASLQIYAGQPRPVAEGADPWDLLNAGRYRAAAERFDAAGDDGQRTGAALAAALSGDLSTASALMPDEPVLPAGVTLDGATTQRLRQVSAVFYEGNEAMRDALAALLTAGE